MNETVNNRVRTCVAPAKAVAVASSFGALSHPGLLALTLRKVASRIHQAILLITTLASITATSTALGQSYPTKPVKIIVPFSAGTATDIVARQLGARLSELWGQGVVVENQAGAAGNIGAGAGAKAAPDGYTLIMLGLPHAINASLYKDVPYDIPRDFRPIVRVASAPMVIVVNLKFPANSIQELIAMAKAKPNEIMYGSNGNGSVGHLAFELLKAQTGVQLTHVPYKSVAPMLSDILGNQIPLGAPAAASVVSHAKAGTLKVLAITTAKRSSAFPGVPTVAESGIPGYDVSGWSGLVAPARTPDAIIDKIYTDVAKVAQSKEFIESVHLQAMEVDVLNPAGFRAFLASELDKWSKLVRDSGTKVE